MVSAVNDREKKNLYRLLEKSGCGIHQNEPRAPDYSDIHRIIFERIVREHRQKQLNRLLVQCGIVDKTARKSGKIPKDSNDLYRVMADFAHKVKHDSPANDHSGYVEHRVNYDRYGVRRTKSD
jgi:hypothetical protein